MAEERKRAPNRTFEANIARPGSYRSRQGKDSELREAIIASDDNLIYGDIVSAYIGNDDAITALTNDGIEELFDIPAAARQAVE